MRVFRLLAISWIAANFLAAAPALAQVEPNLGTAAPYAVLGRNAIPTIGTVTCTDTGPGIPEADASHVFDRFYQTDTGRSRGGTGLGLAFCKRAVELHGGKIGVVNGGQAGAVIEFTIPAASRVPAPEVVPA